MSDKMFSVEIQKEFNVLSKTWEDRVFVKLYVAARASGLLAALGDKNWRTLCALATYMDPSGQCYPSQSELAKALGIGRQSANERIQALLKFRWQGRPIVTATKRRRTSGRAKKGERWASTCYTILPVTGLLMGAGEPMSGKHDIGKPVSAEPVSGNPDTGSADTNKNHLKQEESHSSSEEASSPPHPGHPAARGPGNAGMPKGDGSKEGPAVESPATATEAAVNAGGAPVPPVPAAPLPVDAAAERAEERGGANPQSTLGVARGGVPVAARHQDAANAAAQASLFGLHGEDSEAPSAQGRAPSKDAAGRPGTHALLRRHAALFAEKIGSSLAIGWAKDGALAKKLLQVYDAETVERLQRRFFAQGPDSYAAKVGYTFGEFYREVPALLVAEKEAERRRHLTREQERSKALLIQQKMPPETAADLALRFSYADIQRQVRAMEHRKGIKTPVGALKKAIEEGWPVPDEANGGEGRYRPYPLPESEATAHAT